MNRDTLIKAVCFDYPSAVPVIYHINPSCWDCYPREELSSLVESHPLLFPQGLPDFVQRGGPVEYAPWSRAGSPWKDPWGCIWETSQDGFIGAVTSHPLADIQCIEDFTPPDPEHTTHWFPAGWNSAGSVKGGSIGFFDCLPSGEIGHGHTFLKLIDLFGYEQALLGLHDQDPRILKALEMIEDFNLGLVERFITRAEVEWLGYAEDLGMQQGPLISPDLLRKWILPSYQRIMEPAKEHGIIVHMHSDGDIKALAEDLLTLPIDVLNIQDLVNGLDWIEASLKGKVALDIDIDRQHITPWETPDEVRKYLLHLLRKFSDPAGGLIITYGLYPGTPLANAEAIMDVLEEAAGGRLRW